MLTGLSSAREMDGMDSMATASNAAQVIRATLLCMAFLLGRWLRVVMASIVYNSWYSVKRSFHKSRSGRWVRWDARGNQNRKRYLTQETRSSQRIYGRMDQGLGRAKRSVVNDTPVYLTLKWISDLSGRREETKGFACLPFCHLYILESDKSGEKSRRFTEELLGVTFCFN